MENLVTLDLRYSRLKKAWKGTKIMFQLKFLYLSHCYQLVETPNFSGINNLKELLLNDCKSLVKVDESILCLKELVVLDMKNCTKIRKFPFDIFKLKSLESVDVSGCSMVKYQSSFSSWILRTKGAESIHSPLSHVLDSSCLKNLSMRDCNLSCLPSEVGNLILLETLDLSGNNLGTLPNSFWGLTRLKKLRMQSCNLSCLPNEVGNLTSLEILSLNENNFRTLPDDICNLTSLTDLNLCRCNLLHLPGQIGRLSSLRYLHLRENDLCTLPDSICDLRDLSDLKLSSCKLSCLPDRIGMLRSLSSLDLEGNNDLLSLPNSCRDLSYLDALYIDKCRRLQSLPQLPENLNMLCASGCTSLESIDIPAKFRDQYLYLQGCNMLVKNDFANDLMERIGQSIPVSSQHLALPDFKIILPGDEVPNWFKYKSIGSRLSVAVPRKIRDWFLCIVFTMVLPDGLLPGCYSRLEVSLNKPMRFRFTHGVDILPGDQNHQIMIASAGNADSHRHGELRDFLVHLRGICPGDELEIEINPEDDPWFKVKACGINFIYEDDEDGDADHEKTKNYRANDLQVSEYKGSR